MSGQNPIPTPVNEPVKAYAPDSPERIELQAMLDTVAKEHVEVPVMIGSETIHTGDTVDIVMPNSHQEKLGTVHKATAGHVNQAIDAARKIAPEWAAMPQHERAAIFLRAAELLAGPWRARINAACMLTQGKTCHQSEIDAACELIDFWRFNASFAERIGEVQPISAEGIWNRSEVRPLEGFIFAVSPFNFLSIAMNLPTAPALMGNVVVWKPAHATAVGAYHLMQLLKEAGLPDGVINVVPGDGPEQGKAALASEHLAGIHFTGSTNTFRALWKGVANNLENYRTFPRLVGETGGKDFIVAHPSADPIAVATAIVRGGFEYQGQKCSAASRIYVPKSLWPVIRDKVVSDLKEMPVGDIRDFRNFMGAVIDERAFDKISGYQKIANETGNVLFGGKSDKSKGYMIDPTFVQVDDPKHTLMQEEIFGPVVTVYVYDDAKWQATLDMIDQTSPYALTGAVFAQDRFAAVEACNRLRQSAGNFYINDKPTGAVVGQQPFGGARASGTNDKAGSLWNLARFTSPRSIKETFVPARDYRYPFMG